VEQGLGRLPDGLEVEVGSHGWRLTSGFSRRSPVGG
jgi:hypothetical protein